jgi:hypothetical protein
MFFLWIEKKSSSQFPHYLIIIPNYSRVDYHFPKKRQIQATQVQNIMHQLVAHTPPPLTHRNHTTHELAAHDVTTDK